MTKQETPLEQYITKMESVLARHFAPGNIYHGQKGAMRLAREIGPALAEFPKDEVKQVLGSLYTRLLVRFTFATGVPVSSKPWLREIQKSIDETLNQKETRHDRQD